MTSRWIAVSLWLAVGGAVAAAPAPQAPSGNGRLAGRVLDARTHAPISGAIVTLTGHGAPDRVLAGSDGAFSFDALPQGTFGLSASKPGWYGGGFDQRSPSEPAAPIALANGDTSTSIVLPLWRLAAISGVVTNAAGEPLVNVHVQALTRTLLEGRWRLLPGAFVTTDDRGRYRLAGLDDGAYAIAARPDLDVETPLLLSLLSANPASAADIMAGVVAAGRDPDVDASVERDAPAFYATAASAAHVTLIDVTSGSDRTGVDFHLTRARTVRVSGRVTGRAEVIESVAGLIVRLLPADTTGRAPLAPFDVADAACDDAGRFEFSAVPPGRYVLEATQATTPAPGAPNPVTPAPTLWGRTPVVVRAAASTNGITLAVETGRIMSGRIAMDGATGSPAPTPAPAIDVSTIALRLDPADAPFAGAPSTWPGHATADGRFAMTDVPPGRYMLRVTNLPRGWILRSAIVAGHDALDEPVTIGDADLPGVAITLSTTPLGSLTGRADPHTVVVVFSQTPSLRADSSPGARRTRRVRPASDGSFAIGGLPSGDYFAAAIGGVQTRDWQAPASLDAIARRATRVHIADGAASAIDLTVIK